MFEIKPCVTYDERKKFYCYLINPNIPREDYFLIDNVGYKMIKGGSYEIVERKVIKQLKAWEMTKDKDNARFEEYKAESKAYHDRLYEEYKNSDDLPF